MRFNALDCAVLVLLQRLKAALSQQTTAACVSVAMGSGAMVPQRMEQSQLLVQQPDAPSPAQPQVLHLPTHVISLHTLNYCPLHIHCTRLVTFPFSFFAVKSKFVFMSL